MTLPQVTSERLTLEDIYTHDYGCHLGIIRNTNQHGFSLKVNLNSDRTTKLFKKFKF